MINSYIEKFIVLKNLLFSTKCLLLAPEELVPAELGNSLEIIALLRQNIKS